MTNAYPSLADRSMPSPGPDHPPRGRGLRLPPQLQPDQPQRRLWLFRQVAPRARWTPRRPAKGPVKIEDPEGPPRLRRPAPLSRPTPRSPAQLEGDLDRDRRFASSRRLAPGDGSAPAGRRAASCWPATLKVRVGLEMPAPRESRPRRRFAGVERDGLTIAHFDGRPQGERRPDPGRPAFSPSQPNGRLTVLFTGRGQGRPGHAPKGKPSPIAAGPARPGADRSWASTPCSSASRTTPMSRAARRRSRSTLYFECYNPSLAGPDRAQDLATVVSWARALAGVREVNLVAPGPSRPARPAGQAATRRNLPNLRSTSTSLDYGDGTKLSPRRTASTFPASSSSAA